MTDIEELLRAALHAAPPVAPTVTDPVSTVAAQVRSGRRQLAAGVVAICAAAAAIVVPLSVLGVPAARPAGRLVPAVSPTPTLSADARGVTVWDANGAVAVARGGGYLWELKQDSVVKVDPSTYQPLRTWHVAAGAEGIAYGDGVVWVWTLSTHLDTVAMQGTVEAVDVSLPDHVLRYTVKNKALDTVLMLPQPGAFADALAVVGNDIVQLRAGKSSISVVAEITIPSESAAGSSPGLGATGAGAYWAATGKHLYELDVQRSPDGTHVIGSQPKDAVPWAGPVLAPAGPDAIWSYDGSRLVALTPSYLHSGSSVAQGDRISFPGGNVAAVANDGVGGLFVSVEAGMVPGSPGDVRPGLYHLSRSMIADPNGLVLGPIPSLAGVSPQELAGDGRGGVDFADGNGRAEHWTPRLTPR